jgi:magnesium-transporting ATPase (P-type)
VRPLSVFVIADKVRPESADAVRKPRQLGIEVAMMTGDTEDIARAVELLDDPNDPVFHCQRVLTPRRRAGPFGIREKGQLHPVLSMNGPELLSELIPGHAGCGG